MEQSVRDSNTISTNESSEVLSSSKQGHLEKRNDSGDWINVQGDSSCFVEEHIKVLDSDLSPSSVSTHSIVTVGNPHDHITIDSPSIVCIFLFFSLLNLSNCSFRMNVLLRKIYQWIIFLHQ